MCCLLLYWFVSKTLDLQFREKMNSDGERARQGGTDGVKREMRARV